MNINLLLLVLAISTKMILIITLLSITEATAVLCTTENVSTFTVQLRDKIVDALKERINTSDMQELQFAEKGMN